MSSGNDINSWNTSSGMTNQEIKTTLVSIYEKIINPPLKEAGYDLFLKLVRNNLFSSLQMSLIINHVEEFLLSLTPKEKEPCLKLLSLIFYSSSNEEESVQANIYYPYIPPVLAILQNLIQDGNSLNFPTISNIFAEIVQNTMPTDIEASNIDLEEEEKNAYEMLQSFCIDNMESEEKSNRVVGSVCLTKLVENCPVVLQKQYMKMIWEVIINSIDKKNFNAKYELLNCLISLILGAESLFTPYAHTTLYKVLDFLADVDWVRRKLALNVIYTLIFYCKEEILPLKDHILSFLRALKTDKVKEVREVCLLILKIFNENEQKVKEKDNNKSTTIINKKKVVNKNDNKNKKSINIKRAGNASRSGKKISSNENSNKGKNKSAECLVPEKKEKNRSQNIDNNNDDGDNKNNNVINISVSQAKRGGGGFSATMKNQTRDTSNDTGGVNPPKLVNRKEDKTFINEKMVIKPDPNKSIFKSNPNPAFFNQANTNSKDIVLVSKAEPKKHINIINNNINRKVIKPKEGINKKEIKINSNINEIKKEKEKESVGPQSKPGPIKRNKIVKKNLEKEVVKERNIKKREIKNGNENDDNDNNSNCNKNLPEEKESCEIQCDSNIINTLLSEMNSLSEKQLSLIDIMDNIQTETQGQIEELNGKIIKLERNVQDLNNELNYLREEN